MGIIGSFFRFLFWVLVLSWSISLLKRFFAWMMGGPSSGTAQQQPDPEQRSSGSRRLVRDPMCGMHVAEELAVPTRVGTEVMHFCSTECRDRYLRATQKMAANE
jgi:YHS domain-containing protein